MRVSRGRMEEPAAPGTRYAPHTGEVQLDSVLAADGMFVNHAYYAAGARTYWHRHEHGQLLLITSGKGVVMTRSGDVETVRAGDVVHAAPGEEHWHGAAVDCFVTYTSVSLGRTDTFDEVTNESYAGACC